jgi:CheY-like chemotaxis protein
MLTAPDHRVDGSIARIRRSGDRLERSLDALRRSRYRLQPIAGGATPSVSDLSARSIVVVEENIDNLDVFAAFLRGCGAHVFAAQCVDVALQYLSASAVDVIMTDVSVLWPDAAAFVDRVRSIPRHETTPILAVTGWTEKDVHPAECGFTAFMQKPVDLDRLAAELLRLAGAGASVSARVAS